VSESFTWEKTNEQLKKIINMNAYFSKRNNYTYCQIIVLNKYNLGNEMGN